MDSYIGVHGFNTRTIVCILRHLLPPPYNLSFQNNFLETPIFRPSGVLAPTPYYLALESKNLYEENMKNVFISRLFPGDYFPPVPFSFSASFLKNLTILIFFLGVCGQCPLCPPLPQGRRGWPSIILRLFLIFSNLRNTLTRVNILGGRNMRCQKTGKK